MLLRARIISKYLLLCLGFSFIFSGLSCTGKKNEELGRDSNLSTQSPLVSGNTTETDFKSDLSQEEVSSTTQEGSSTLEEETAKGDDEADEGSGTHAAEDEAAFRLIVN